MPRTGSRPLTTNEPSASYLSRKGLARLHDSMAAHVAAGRLPGLTTLVAHGDDVHIDTVGRPSFAADAPLARDAIFRIASLTKPITAVATISLVEEGADLLARRRASNRQRRWVPRQNPVGAARQ